MHMYSIPYIYIQQENSTSYSTALILDWLAKLRGQDMTFCLIDDHTYSTLQDIAFEVFETPEQHGGGGGMWI